MPYTSNVFMRKFRVCRINWRGLIFQLVLSFFFFGAVAHSTELESWISLQDSWTWWKGASHPSSGDDSWRGLDFNDESWSESSAPFYYGEPYEGGTVITDMRNSYTSIFFRKVFVVVSPGIIQSMSMEGVLDDGMIVWVNGVEVGRVNMPAGDVAFDALAASATEPTAFELEISQPDRLLNEGENILAVQVFNGSRSSSDLVFDLSLEGTFPDLAPPALVSIFPSPGEVDGLNFIQVVFSEPVQGVDREDLMVNGESPIELNLSHNATTFVFVIEPVSSGQVQVEWIEDHEISDLGGIAFEPEGASGFWVYQVLDTTSPTLDHWTPADGTLLSKLEFLEAWFSEPVVGVKAEDLFINGESALEVSGSGAGPYRFVLPDIAPGEIAVEWAADAGITDLAQPPNSFGGGSWTFYLNPGLEQAPVVISEIMAVNRSGLTDPDGAVSDWLELWNRGDQAVDISGWSLTDDPENPGMWEFPSGSTIDANGRIILFADGYELDPRSQDPPFHLNFQLSADGEYLGLFDNAAPRNAVFEFRPEYPEQRADLSYGFAEDGSLQYLDSPTPGDPNSGGSLISGVVDRVRFSHESGFYESPFLLTLETQTPLTQIYYTTDGTDPSASNGELYETPFLVQAGGGIGGVVIRAVATRGRFLDSETEQVTYLFPEAIMNQTARPSGWPNAWGPVTADYEMDPRVTGSEQYKERAIEAVTSIPSLSLAMDLEDLFHPSRGIYANTQSKGPNWERPVHAEFIFPGSDLEPGKVSERISIAAGIKIQGGSSRIPAKAPKHSFRLVFKSDYGPKKLRERIFPDSPVEEFDTLVLDAGLNLVFIHPDHGQRVKSQYVRDQFVSDIHSQMGYPAFHGRFFNLYINGLYWGLFGVHERTDDAFAASYLGGEKDEWDVLKNTTSFSAVSGDFVAWNQMMTLARQDLSLKSNFDALARIMDVTGLIDYMILNIWMGNTDWPHHNWYVARKRELGAKFNFFSWDAEHVLKSLQENKVGADNGNTPAEIYSRLRSQSSEFRLMFADRVHKWFYRDGPFAENAETGLPNAVEVYKRRLDEVDLAVILESARWGDLRSNSGRPGQPYERDVEWWNEWLWLRDTYFPNRSQVALNQLKGQGLYPGLEVPELSILNRWILPGTPILLSVADNTAQIFYTLNGTDPRLAFRDRLDPAAILYDPQNPPLVESNGVLKARAFDNGTWSALLENPIEMDPTYTPLQITEIHYHPFEGELFEFIEIRNNGVSTLDLSGWTMDGVDALFPVGSQLQPGEIGVIASSEDVDAFVTRYPGVAPLVWFEGRLSNAGERIGFYNHLGEPQGVGVYYDDSGSWPNGADGQGYSLVLKSALADGSAPDAWTLSREQGGSPGAFEDLGIEPSGLQFSEVLAWNTMDLDGVTNSPDWIEIHNPTSNSISLEGWTIQGLYSPIADDQPSQTWEFPEGSQMAPNEYLMIFGESAQGINPASETALVLSFSLAREGETLRLFNADGIEVDAITFGPQVENISIGRIEPGSSWTLLNPTPGDANEVALIQEQGDLKINEWLANAEPGSEDWLEIFAPAETEFPVQLDRWKIQINERWIRFPKLSFAQPGTWTRFWADGRGYESHLSDNLPAAGAALRLFNPDLEEVDFVEYAQQIEGVSMGRSPDGSSALKSFDTPTPGASNLPRLQLDEIRFIANTNEVEITFQKELGRVYWVDTLNPSVGVWAPAISIEADASGAQVLKLSTQEKGDSLWIRLRIK